MCGFGHRPLHVKVKDGFGRPSLFLRQSAPPGITHAIGAISAKTIPYEINIGMIIICRPVSLEIVEKR